MRIYTLLKQAFYKLGLISDYIIDSGTSGAWEYVKYASGRCECWNAGDDTIASGDLKMTASGSSYYSAPVSVTLPNFFVSVETFVGMTAAANTQSITKYGRFDSSTKKLSFRVRKDNNTTTGVGVTFIVKGKWK